MSNWNPFAEPQDYVDFAGIRSPGLAEVVGASLPFSWDEIRTYAVIGSFPRFTGKKLSHFSVKLRLYTIEDWEGWYALEPLLSKVPRRGLVAKAIDIAHPQLAAVKINACVVEEIMQPEQTADSEWTIELRLLEFRKPQIAVATADGAKATPADPEDAHIDQLNQQSIAEDAAFDATP